MRALLFRGPWQLDVADAPRPDPGADDVLLDVVATGLCGSDIHGFSGETDRRTAGQVMGHETVARVVTGGGFTPGSVVTINPIVSCGTCDLCVEGNTQVCPDARVIGVDPALPGSFADQLMVPARNIIVLDGQFPLLHGALVEPLAVGYHALMQASPHLEDRLLVIGGGPIGQAVALAARRRGLHNIMVSEPTAERRDLLQSLGFDTAAPEALDAVMAQVFDGRKATVVVDAVGVDATFAAAVDNSATQARLVLVGMGTNIMTIAPYGITVSERVLIGSYCYSDQHFRETAEWVATGQPDLDLIIERALPLDQGPRVFAEAASGTGGSRKILFYSNAGADLLHHHEASTTEMT